MLTEISARRGGKIHLGGGLRHDWQLEEVLSLFNLPFNDLIFQAQTVHREHFDPNEVQISSLLSIKTGACSEDCAYCPQSAHYQTGLGREELIPVDEVFSGFHAPAWKPGLSAPADIRRRSAAICIPTLERSPLYTSVRGPSFRHGLPESSHKDVNLGAGNLPESSTCASGKLPSMALDSGIHAGMTAFLGRRDLCITMRAGPWERANVGRR